MPAIYATETNVFPRFLKLAYPVIDRGEGVWLYTSDGRKILDACSGGAMVTCLGHAVPELVRLTWLKISIADPAPVGAK